MRSVLLKICALSLATTLHILAADPSVGTWKLNLAKSKFHPGPAPKSQTATFTSDGEWINSKSEGTDAAGMAVSSINRYKRDGKEYPFKTRDGEGVISIKTVDAHNNTGSIKRDGKVVSTFRTNFSKDGKVRTMTTEGTNPDGKKFKNVLVFDKQ
ncbi:MAG TPA: hypothetical protein VM120_28100 [Bryobacteraceae bacterium]|nr:hypothetical protein [Bryobacteraceae bacterium]